MQITKEQFQEQRAQFNGFISKFVAKLHERALEQFVYNCNTNVPKGIVSPCQVGFHAFESGVVSAISDYVHFKPDDAARIAHDILEDVNFHDAAKILRDFVEK